MCGRYEFCFKRNINDPVISEEQAASITQQSNNEVFPSDLVLAFIGRHGSIQALCMQLKSPYKEVAYAHFCEELSVNEIAQRTNKNPKTIQTQLYRAKAMLKKMLERSD